MFLTNTSKKHLRIRFCPECEISFIFDSQLAIDNLVNLFCNRFDGSVHQKGLTFGHPIFSSLLYGQMIQSSKSAIEAAFFCFLHFCFTNEQSATDQKLCIRILI